MKILLLYLTSLIDLTSVTQMKSQKECKRYHVPEGFIFSTATSAYQIEGAAREDGKGPSDWDMFAKIPGAVRDGENGDVACDSYHKYKEDIEMLKYLGVKQYRFSISWPRILPDGSLNHINQKGIDWYNNFINKLLEAGIEPVVTMLHFDEPEALNNIGGWLNKDMAGYFGNYSRLLYKAFGDRVKKWITLNEPLSVSTFGYCGQNDIGSPGDFRVHCPWTKYLSGHYQLLAHAEAYRIYEKEFKNQQKGLIGIALNSGWYEPVTDSPEDLAAAERARSFSLNWFADPIFKGDYPQTMKDMILERSLKDGYVKSRLPEFTDDEKQKLKGSLDFLGFNYYHSFEVQNRVDFPYGIPQEQYDGATDRNLLFSHPTGLRKLINYASKEYGVPILITENGYPTDKDSMNDLPRIEYLREHIINVLLAIEDGANVMGYTLWSLMDNFEWNYGYLIKYGVYHVDFNDPEKTRTPKASAEWYKSVIAQGYIEKCE